MKNPQKAAERAAELVSRMTLEEKISQLGNLGAAIPRLGIPFYNYWSEASHGYFGPFKYRPMDVTSFPVCLAMSQSWDRSLIRAVTEAISDECRAYANTDGDELHMWCPTINMARDPRNGRSDENFGEDPYLAGELAAEYVRGLQGEDETCVKVIATPKHYALNSSENNRHKGSSNADEATIREYYARPFETVVRKAHPESLMTSYNRINGVPASCNDFLLTRLLRQEWGFDGFVVSDCGAVGDVYGGNSLNADGKRTAGHAYAKNLAEASAMTLNAGCDMSCGAEHKYNLLQALEQGLVSEDALDRSLIRIFTSRMRLGLFDEEWQNPYAAIGKDRVCSKEHAALSVKAAEESIVLLKNDQGLLPLDRTKLKSVLVVGPNAIYRELGGYSAGSISKVVETPVNIMALEGIRRLLEGSGVEVRYEKGWCSGREATGDALSLLPGAELGGGDGGFDPEAIMKGVADVLGPNVTLESLGVAFMSPERYRPEDPDRGSDNGPLFARALAAAKEADAVIVIAGTDATNASEEHDRETLELPYGQDEKIQQLLDANANTIVVISALGAVTGDFFEEAHTVVNAHFAGEAQGTAIARVLFGEVNPSAKLTATWYASEEELPHINDYGIKKNDTLCGKARTYMYFEGKTLFPFGHGLSYTSFSYSDLRLSAKDLDANDTLEVSLDVTNTGTRDGAEIVQLYAAKVTPEGLADNKPFRQLKGFEKVFLKAGETRTVTFRLPLSELRFWSYLRGRMIVEPGEYRIEIGASSVDIRLSETISVSGVWKAPLSSVALSADRQILQPGETTALSVTAALADSTLLTDVQTSFCSSDETVLRVDETGKVTALGAGAASICAVVRYEGNALSRCLPFAVKDA